MSELDRRIKNCFGMEDHRFARHSSEKKAAYECLSYMLEKNTSWKECKKAINSYLGSITKNQQHIDEQLKRAKKFFKVWL